VSLISKVKGKAQYNKVLTLVNLIPEMALLNLKS
jgi:hypothetical protein